MAAPVTGPAIGLVIGLVIVPGIARVIVPVTGAATVPGIEAGPVIGPGRQIEAPASPIARAALIVAARAATTPSRA